MKELNSIRDFVKSLESTQLTGDQQAILLIGESECFGGLDVGGCVNNGCKNSTPDCESASNGGCVNIPNCKCPPTNTASCSSSNTSGCDENDNPSCTYIINTANCKVNICSGTNGIGFGTTGFPGFDI